MIPIRLHLQFSIDYFSKIIGSVLVIQNMITETLCLSKEKISPLLLPSLFVSQHFQTSLKTEHAAVEDISQSGKTCTKLAFEM